MTAAVGSTVRRRELYLDALRTAAIVRVVIYHTFGGAWLSWAFPAMGVMFALAGGLMVKSLDRQPATTVIRNRIRRLLPALWVFGAVMVPLMIWQGGALDTWSDPNTGDPTPLWHVVFWLVPLVDPPGNEWGENVTVVLWYLRTYLWLVMLSPLLLAAFRRLPIPTLIAPLGVLFAQAFGYLPNGDDGLIWALVSDLGIFAPCWMLGFAHRTGSLKRLPVPGLVGFSAVAAAAGVAWALSHPSEGDDGLSYDLNGIPIAQALWSIAVILPLLRFAPDASWIGRTPVLAIRGAGQQPRGHDLPLAQHPDRSRVLQRRAAGGGRGCLGVGDLEPPGVGLRNGLGADRDRGGAGRVGGGPGGAAKAEAVAGGAVGG